MKAAPIILLNQANGATTGDMSGDLKFGIFQSISAPALVGQSYIPLKLQEYYGYSIQANYLTGSPTGTLKVQASNDGINFCDIPGTPFVVTGTGSFLWNFTWANYLYSQLVWTHTGGSSGTLAAIGFIRGF